MYSIHSSFIRSGTALVASVLALVGLAPAPATHLQAAASSADTASANASPGRALDALAALPLNFEPRELGRRRGVRRPRAGLQHLGRRSRCQRGPAGRWPSCGTGLCDRRRDRRGASRGRDAPARRDAPLRRRPAGLAGQRRDVRARRRARRPPRHRRRLLRRPAATGVRLHRQAGRQSGRRRDARARRRPSADRPRRPATCSCTWPGRCCASARRWPTRRSTASAGRSRVPSRWTPRSGRVGFEVGSYDPGMPW